jgi:uncharacterized membrane protein
VTEPENDRTVGSPERFVTFLDAVVAIALTLLILPLLETISDVGEGESLGTLVHDHLSQFAAFALSFAVISQFWWAHHRMFRHIAELSLPIVRWSQLWMFAIVFMPISTAITAAFDQSAATVGLYGGTLVLTSGSMMMLAVYVHRHPELNSRETPATREHVLSNVSVFVAMLVATLIGCVFAEAINYWAFLLMFLTGPIQTLIRNRWRRSGRAGTGRREAGKDSQPPGR